MTDSEANKPMSAEKRAEKIMQALKVWRSGLFYVRGAKGFLEFLGAQIRSAEKEACEMVLRKNDDWHEQVRRDVVKAAFRAGQEQMKEKAATTAFERCEQSHWNCKRICTCARGIRAIPISEAEK